MKNLIYILIGTFLVFTSCDKDEDTTVNNYYITPPPTGYQTPKPHGQYRLDTLSNRDSNYVTLVNLIVYNQDSTDYIYYDSNGEFLKGVHTNLSECYPTLNDYMALGAVSIMASITPYDSTIYDSTSNSIIITYQLWDNYYVFHYSKSNYAPADTIPCN